MLGDKRVASLFTSEPAAHKAPAYHDAPPMSDPDRRTHFPPIWYPNGNYTPYTWLPFGMLDDHGNAQCESDRYRDAFRESVRRLEHCAHQLTQKGTILYA